jgi:hypothetical protein
MQIIMSDLILGTRIDVDMPDLILGTLINADNNV